MQQVTSADGTRIAYEQLGSGPPLLLIPGALNDRGARSAGRPLAAALAQQHTVICFDRRGRGDSGDTPPYALARELEDIDALLQQLGGPAHVYGHSSGGLLAFEAAHAGLPVSKLVIYEPPLALREARTPLPPDIVERLEQLIERDQRSATVSLFLSETIGIPEPVVQNMMSGPQWASRLPLAHTLSFDVRLAMNPSDVLARAAALRVPSLLLSGERSPAWMQHAADRLAAAIPGASRKTLVGQSHDVEPLALAPELIGFFAG
jgi:pimeloyl-ACP methyl ester carboxylesterase